MWHLDSVAHIIRNLTYVKLIVFFNKKWYILVNWWVHLRWTCSFKKSICINNNLIQINAIELIISVRKHYFACSFVFRGEMFYEELQQRGALAQIRPRRYNMPHGLTPMHNAHWCRNSVTSLTIGCPAWMRNYFAVRVIPAVWRELYTYILDMMSRKTKFFFWWACKQRRLELKGCSFV